jgi:hypothetical protein
MKESHETIYTGTTEKIRCSLAQFRTAQGEVNCPNSRQGYYLPELYPIEPRKRWVRDRKSMTLRRVNRHRRPGQEDSVLFWTDVMPEIT